MGVHDREGTPGKAKCCEALIAHATNGQKESEKDIQKESETNRERVLKERWEEWGHSCRL